MSFPNWSGQYGGARPPFIQGGWPAAAMRRMQQHNQPGPHGQHHGNGNGHGNGHPHISALQRWLAGDSTYQNQLASYQNTYQNFLTQNNQEANRVNEDFNTAQDRMGLQNKRDTQGMIDDYGARGILTSGLFTKSLSDYNTDYGNKLADLTLDKQRNLSDLGTQANNERQTYIQNKQLARQQAIQRRAQRLGITG